MRNIIFCFVSTLIFSVNVLATGVTKPLSRGTTACMSVQDAQKILTDFIMTSAELEEFFDDYISFELHYSVDYDYWRANFINQTLLTLKWHPQRAQYETGNALTFKCAHNTDCHRGFAVRCDNSVQFWTDDVE